MSYTDAIARVSAIQAQIAALAAGPGDAPGAASAARGAVSGAGTGATAPTTQYGRLQPAATGAPSFGALLQDSQAAQAAQATGGVGAAGLPAGAASRLTSGQQTFAARLAAQTGLAPSVVSAWLLAEESGGAAAARQSAGNHDWLNIGYTDSGTFGAADSIWADPVAAADATAGWLRGQDTIPGYGRASAGIQAILATAGRPVADQVAAIQGSGWASSGYPDLPGLVAGLG